MALHRMEWAARVVGFVVLATLATTRASAGKNDPPATAKDRESLAISKPVICKEIRGYEDYDARSDDSLRKDEKLLIYYLPLRYEQQTKGERFHVHFSQEGRIRRRGQKAAVYAKKDMLTYDVTYDPPKRPVYLQNIVSLKELKPGEYEYDIVLTDKLGGATVTRSVPFKVVAAAAEKADPATAPQPDAKPKAKAKKALARKPRRNGEVERLIESILNDALIDSMID